VNPGPKIVVLDAFTAGGAQADQLRTENHFNLNEVVSLKRFAPMKNIDPPV
jgi:hypothetical protein